MPFVRTSVLCVDLQANSKEKAAILEIALGYFTPCHFHLDIFISEKLFRVTQRMVKRKLHRDEWTRDASVIDAVLISRRFF